ncbi:MAG: hypothetical protein ACP5HX_10530 [Thermoproteota archaeon]
MIGNFFLNKEACKNFAKNILHSPYFWILVISVLFLRTILFSQGIPAHGDLCYPSSLDMYEKAFLPLWNEHTSVTNLENVNRMITFLLIFVARLYGGIDTLAKLFFIIPLVISGFSVALLVKYILRKVFPDHAPESLVIVASAFTYMINPWVLEQIQAPFYWLSYAVTPAIILLSFRLFSEGSISFAIGTTILWTIASTSPHYTISSFLIIFIVWLLSFVLDVLHGKEKLSDRFKRDLKLWGIIIGIFIAFNACWILPIAFALTRGPISPGYTFTPDMLNVFSRNSNLLNIFGGVDQWITWYTKNTVLGMWIIFDKVAWPITLGIALTVTCAKKTDSRLFYILSIILIIGLFCGLGGNNPIYRWLATDAPFNSYYGWILRVPGKFSYLLWPAYAASIGIVGQSVYTYSISKNKSVKKILIVLVTAILFVTAIGYAVIKGQDYFNFYYAPVPVPDPYQRAFTYISEHLNNSRVADLAPYFQGIGKNSLQFEASYTWNPDRIAGYFVPRSIPSPSIGVFHFTYSSIWQPAYQNFGEPLSLNGVSWFPVYGVDYILYHDDIVGTQAIAQQDLQVLNQTGFELIKRWDYVYLYKVPENLGRIYTLSWAARNDSESEVAFDNVKVQEVLSPPTIDDIKSSGVNIIEIKEVDPTLWYVKLNAISPFKLIFTEGFDPYWTATIKTDKEIAQVSSQKIFGSINSFAINQTGLLEIIIEYEPQIWFYHGLIISLLTFTGCVLYLAKGPLYRLVSRIRKFKLASIKPLEKGITR